jgi:hypothetical protein
VFLEVKVGDCALEGGVSHDSEIGAGVTKILTEAGGERGEEDLIPNREPEVLKLVGDGFEDQAVVI